MWLLDDAASDLTILIQIVDHNNHSHEPDLSNGLLGSSRMSGRWERAHARLRAGRQRIWSVPLAIDPAVARTLARSRFLPSQSTLPRIPIHNR